MTQYHMLTLIRFITRTGMYIPVQDRDNVVSFVHGYELGCNDGSFTQHLRDHLERALHVPHSADGWPGQIQRYSDREGLTWVTAFKQTSLDVIVAEGGWDEEMQQLIRTRIIALVERIQENGGPWFNASWLEEWSALFPPKSSWPRELWAPAEYSLLLQMAEELRSAPPEPLQGILIPSTTLLALATAFTQLNAQA